MTGKKLQTETEGEYVDKIGEDINEVQFNFELELGLEPETIRNHFAL